jgi:1-acyl-sn-glycerol-3-phosphate acyltransferase
VRRVKRAGWILVNGLQAVFLCVWSAFWISAALVALAVTLRRDVPLAMARTCWAPALLKFAGARLEVDGLDQVDFRKPHVFVMNHQSMIDIPAAFVALPVNLRFIAKKVLARVPFLGWYMAATGMIFVDRSRGEQAVRSLREAGERIRAGASILAFPEGTRSPDGSILPFKKGPFVVALEAGVPVVPVAIDGAAAVLPFRGFSLRPGTIRVRVGRPIETAGIPREGRDELMRTVREAIVEMHRSLGSEPPGPLLARTAGPAGASLSA